jgi:hypothetical protein
MHNSVDNPLIYSALEAPCVVPVINAFRADHCNLVLDISTLVTT